MVIQRGQLLRSYGPVNPEGIPTRRPELGLIDLVAGCKVTQVGTVALLQGGNKDSTEIYQVHDVTLASEYTCVRPSFHSNTYRRIR